MTTLTPLAGGHMIRTKTFRTHLARTTRFNVWCTKTRSQGKVCSKYYLGFKLLSYKALYYTYMYKAECGCITISEMSTFIGIDYNYMGLCLNIQHKSNA